MSTEKWTVTRTSQATTSQLHELFEQNLKGKGADSHLQDAGSVINTGNRITGYRLNSNFEMQSNTPRTLEEALAQIAARDAIIARKREEHKKILAEYDARLATKRDLQSIDQALLEAEAEVAALRARNERRRLEQDQALPDYLSQIHRASFHLSRLMPVVTKPGSVGLTTTGRDDIVNKYYPLKLRVWTEFPQLHREAFARIQAAVGDQAAFPSPDMVCGLEKLIMKRLPREFLQSEAFLTDQRTSELVDFLMQQPAQEVMNAYFAANHKKNKVFFDSLTADYQSGESGNGNAPGNAQPCKIRPDCVVLGTDFGSKIPMNEAGDGSRLVHRVAVGEYKAAHKLRARTVSDILLQKTLTEDYMVTLAKQRAKMPSSTSAASGDEASGARFYAYALSQAFHYLIVSGLEFGFVATGETLTFLRIPHDDRTMLLYYSSVFPAYGSGSSPDSPDNGEVELAALPTAQLSSLCLLAHEAMLDNERRATMTVNDLALLAPFPELPESVKDADLDSDSKPTTTTRRRAPLAPEPPSPFDPSSFRPLLPYCTQACLRSLAFDQEIDYGCPNVLLHVRAAAAEHPPPRPGHHAITKEDVVELVQNQLLHNPDLDCECLHNRGRRGAIGSMFKMTLNGFGYTFVAKGVTMYNRRKLVREKRVYDKLAAQQGTLIPVCLGIARLHVPYPLGNFDLVSHMLLMSYAGAPLHARQVQKIADARGIDLDAEAVRTVRELEALGFVDEDEESTINYAWSDELGRVMKIDFDQAKVYAADEATKPVPKPMPVSPDRKRRMAGWDLEGAEERRKKKQHLDLKVEGLLLM